MQGTAEPQGTDGDWRTIGLLSDAPLDQLDTDDAARCDPLVEQLVRQLGGFLRARYDGPGPNLQAPRIGVFGGLGQGKTTVIRSALRRLRGPSGDWKWEERAELFDAAHYKNEDLEFELDRLLGGLAPATGYRLVPGIIAISALVWIVIWSEVPWPLISSLIAITGLGAVLTSLVMPFRYWWRAGQRNGTLGSCAWWRQGKKLLLRQVEILVVDNLDRASLAQQRAVLRALYKHSDDFGFAIVIGFDESRLLDSKPDPEPPGELLRKAIHLEARMPARIAADALRLAWNAMIQAADANPKLAHVLTDPRAVGALARSCACSRLSSRLALALPSVWSMTLCFCWRRSKAACLTRHSRRSMI